MRKESFFSDVGKYTPKVREQEFLDVRKQSVVTEEQIKNQ